MFLTSISNPFFLYLIFILATGPIYSYTPLYMSWSDFRSSVKAEKPKNLEAPLKAVVDGDYLYISDNNRGIHVFEFFNGSTPVPVSFISIRGNRDFEVKDGTIYAESFTDLVILQKVSADGTFTEVNRMTNVFNYDAYQSVSSGIRFDSVDQSKGVVIGYNRIEE